MVSWVVGKIRGGVVDEVSKFEVGGRIRRISSDFMGYPKIFPSSRGPGGPRMGCQGGPGVGPGGARAEARGARAGARGARAGARGGQGWGQGGHGPPGPPLATGLYIHV